MVNRLLYSANSLTLGRYVFSHAQRMIALNTAIKTHLVAMGADERKIEIIPNAVNTRFFSPKRENVLETRFEISPPVILFVGRLVEYKGVEYLMQAFADVVKTVPHTKLVIVGKGPQETELRNLQEKLKLRNVYFLGAVETRLMPEIYAGSDVLVLPSVREPFGNVVIEAMASGKPVIGSYVGGIRDTIIHGATGYHVRPRSSRQISMYLARLLKDEPLRKRLGRTARARAIKCYNLELLTQRIEQICLRSVAG